MAAVGGGTFGLTAVDRRITTRPGGLVQFIAAHPSNYWVGFVTDPAVALFLLAWDVRVLDTAPHVALPCVTIGVVAWTIAEYAAHRWLYHARMPLWRVGHEMHHESPELLIGLPRSEEHTSELQSPCNLVCRLLLEKKKKKNKINNITVLV